MSKYNRITLYNFQANKYNGIIKIDMRNESQFDLSAGMKNILCLVVTMDNLFPETKKHFRISIATVFYVCLHSMRKVMYKLWTSL